MKHDGLVTAILIAIFVISQIVGISLIAKSITNIDCKVNEHGTYECKTVYEDTAVGSRPETQGIGSILYIIIGITVGTIVLLIMAKYNKQRLWKLWFFLAVLFSVTVALGVVTPTIIAWILAFLITTWKIYKPNIYIYNLAEILMYSGIAILLVPILDVWWMIVLLVLISIYDVIAVWKSGHMVTMAKFITGSNAFAGLVIPYTSGKKGKIKHMFPTESKAKKSLGKRAKVKQAILGGGDITFPLLFAGTVLQATVISKVMNGVTLHQAIILGLIPAGLIALGATLAVTYLFIFAKKDKFYPAMPYISAGCLIGWAITFLF